MIAPAKPWYRSRTLAFNVVVLVLTLATAIVDSGALFDPRIVSGALVVVTVGNMALRLITQQPITIAGKPVVAPPAVGT